MIDWLLSTFTDFFSELGTRYYLHKNMLIKTLVICWRLRYVDYDVLYWYLFLSKTWRVVVMKLKSRILHFQSRHFGVPWGNPKTNNNFWHVFKHIARLWGCKISPTCFIYLSLLTCIHLVTITTAECVLTHSIISLLSIPHIKCCCGFWSIAVVNFNVKLNVYL